MVAFWNSLMVLIKIPQKRRQIFLKSKIQQYQCQSYHNIHLTLLSKFDAWNFSPHTPPFIFLLPY